jgi:hypothetical protein
MDRLAESRHRRSRYQRPMRPAAGLLNGCNPSSW